MVRVLFDEVQLPYLVQKVKALNLKNGHNDCLHVHADLNPAVYVANSTASGTLDIWFADDLESFTIRVEYEGLSSPVSGIYIHEPVFLFTISFRLYRGPR
eukprot:TRINITY_DN14177_c0_g1_i1.p1 TRINITY_DN14177_c0_g1~~TRINITY_DN14177_c0_g1_i1.p1  ORF type:complete len:100 (-),score=2.54 TRINITY_DN14177_c0_g1_i1:161-460(-)